ncbi:MULTISPECIES: sensor histidine kinase [Amycolatopsis]|uniref:histidine kinase n=1 Tax=Amycolatopsis thermalba TaxID=944492 RepID=A0ABY4NNW3_9PSEU|nr:MULTISPECIES: sensor histidine kinase [Amycolatopsis]OXM73953.1 sensor histidine kinase [Amycolatopsis sp. KNN50.9b]UQS22330.1 sensor histidine kinase [Amycolatopsis thermalba]
MPTVDVRRAMRVTAGLALGGLSAFAEAVFVIVATLALAVPAARPAVFGATRWFAERDRSRLRRYLDYPTSDDYRDSRALRYLGTRSVVGGLGAGIFVLIALGVAAAGIMVWQLISGHPLGGGDPIGEDQDWYDAPGLLLIGVLLVFLAVQGLIGVVALERRLAHHFFGPTKQERLQRRVDALTHSRAEVVEAVNDERRRIERDLHDGVQQRIVSLGMLLGRARRAKDPERAEALLRQAHEETQLALQELRDVAWRVYPIALDEGGLGTALEALAERSSLPVGLSYALDERVDPATETVAYFVASEAVTNAIKHAAASRIDIAVGRTGRMLTVTISDDGVGGARPDGNGLSGLARRVGAADGVFTVDSPAGGPTVVRAELPCA